MLNKSHLVDSLISAFIASIICTIVSTIIYKFNPNNKHNE